MRFARTIKQIQGLQAYHAGDKLNVEVDIVLDENMSLRDSHDLGESLQYVLESVPTVDRAFVHQDYAGWNLPTHMQQQGEWCRFPWSRALAIISEVNTDMDIAFSLELFRWNH